MKLSACTIESFNHSIPVLHSRENILRKSTIKFDSLVDKLKKITVVI